MVSPSASVLNSTLRLIPDGAITHLMTHPPRRRRPSSASPMLRARYDVAEQPIGDGSIVTATPHAGGNGRHLVHLHGGAYTLQDNHWPFLARFLKRGWAVSLIDYPLAPEHSVEQAVPMIFEAWAHLAQLAGPATRLDLCGDSAGGGLALVLLQHLRDTSGPMPGATVLLSPWSDLVMDDSATIAAARHDRLLALEGLRGAAALYAGRRPLSDPWLSPIKAPLHGLGRIQAWVGTAEMFVPQCRRLADLTLAAPGTELTLHEAHGLPHDWPLFPIRETGQVADAMLRFLTS